MAPVLLFLWAASRQGTAVATPTEAAGGRGGGRRGSAPALVLGARRVEGWRGIGGIAERGEEREIVSGSARSQESRARIHHAGAELWRSAAKYEGT